MNVAQYQALAKQKHGEQKKTLELLKKSKRKDIDKLTEKLHDKIFETIDCLQCANCCKTTGPLFTDKDIERIAKFLRLKPARFIDKYLFIDEDNDYVLQTVPCPFLDAENVCLIYENRPKACKEFPHTDRKKLYQINNLTLKNCKVCPAAYLIVDKLKDVL